MKNNSQPNSRSKEITSKYFQFLDQHIDDVVNGRVLEFMELNQIASKLAISHQHLTDTVRKETGEHPCHFYDEKIIFMAKELLKNKEVSIASISLSLTYDPSNFSKFFKKWTGITPGEFRKKV
ncbi:AraC-like DNA-binding protein [Epilithonimonas hungarica]|uniref:helix-turn-helix domain-containing protein n=1 Tax=Epilithonimonas hungarica TaxID=454006 RepID=UPI00278B1B1F|nr:AraC family transcriptional regulator [Epilithonimonas hungarica]MDP9956574.1 AraC-like DNA-binding protein [Epilithonimonas hungarica]